MLPLAFHHSVTFKYRSEPVYLMGRPRTNLNPKLDPVHRTMLPLAFLKRRYSQGVPARKLQSAPVCQGGGVIYRGFPEEQEVLR